MEPHNSPFPQIADEFLRDKWQNDELAQEAHARLARMSLRQVVGSMPAVNHLEGRQASFVDLKPRGDYDDHSAVVLGLPFGNGWAPHVWLRAKLLQDSLEVPARMIIFPNNTLTNKAYYLNYDEMKQVAESGNFRPLIEQQFRTLDTLNINRFHRVGYSQDAAVGASALSIAANHGYFGLKPSGLFEWPNGTTRTAKQLNKQFTSDGIKPLKKAVNESAIPALSEAQRSRGGIDNLIQLGKLASFGLGIYLRPENRAIRSGFGNTNFVVDVWEAIDGDKELKVLLAVAENSKITTEESKTSVKALQEFYPKRITFQEIKGYGHEMGDNLAIHTILGKMAVTA